MAKKKSKKEIQAEKEAAEQRRLAEEERLRVEEQERKIREQEELKLDEKITAFIKQDKTRIESMMEEYKQIMTTYNDDLKQKLIQSQQELEWKEYLKCSLLPNPRIERDLNTFLMLWEDEKLIFDDIPTLSSFYNQLPTCSSLMEELEVEKAKLIDEKNFQKAELIQTYITKLTEIMLKKCDITTLLILRNLYRYPRESTENMQLEGSENNFKFGLWANLTNNPKHKNVEFLNSSMTCSIPKSLVLQNVAIRMIYSLDISNTIPKAATEAMVVTGGVLVLDLLELPEPPKINNNWTISQVYEKDGLVKVPYPKKKEEGEIDSTTDDSINSVQVAVTIPNYVENSKVMFWNDATKKWDDDGVRDQQFDPVSRKLSFWTSRFAPHALVKGMYLEFPYKNWILNPGVDHATLAIEGKFNSITIIINSDGCRAVGVDGITGTHSPAVLFKKLSENSLNFIAPPDDETQELVGKDLKTETDCIEGISQNCLSFKFQKSPCNSSIAATKLAFQFSLPDDDSVPGQEWKSILYNSSYKHKEDLMPLACIYESNVITDKTKLNMDGKESKLVRKIVIILGYPNSIPNLINPSQ